MTIIVLLSIIMCAILSILLNVWFLISVASGLDLRFSSSGSDPEPWRCKRTDGKKWRCSRDVAPDQKYCERHAHKSRPRSRKHVEVSSHSTSNSYSQKALILPANNHHTSTNITTTTPIQLLQRSTSQFPTVTSTTSCDQTRFHFYLTLL